MLEYYIFVLTLLLAICVYFKSFLQEFFKYRKVFKNIKGPKTLPLGLIAYLFTARSESDRFQILQNLSKRYPNYYALWFGTKYMFITDDPAMAQKLLTYPECVEKNYFMDFFGFPQGLISLKSDRWKHERKLFNHTFGVSVLQSYVPTFNKCIEQSFTQLDEQVDKGEFDIHDYVTEVMMTAILNTTFGKEVKRETAKEFVSKTENLLDIIWQRSMNPILYYDAIYSLTKLKKQEDINRQFIFDFITINWREKLAEIATEPKSFMSEESFINQLIKISNSGRDFKESEINDHIGTMIVAAGDTTSTALNFLFLMVAMHPNVQELIVDELNEVFGKQQQCKDLIIDYGNLSQLKYVDMVIKETLRLYSPATGIFREVKADVDLGIDNVVLPKGTNLIINTYGLHRKTAIWGENANLFEPNNFHPDKERHNYSFLPFAHGTRHCIGNRYAMIFMKLIIAHYVNRYHFTTSLKYEDIRVKAGITLKLGGNLKHFVQLTRRRT
ncbi:unnamed protein product [Diamesa tonsa]